MVVKNTTDELLAEFNNQLQVHRLMRRVYHQTTEPLDFIHSKYAVGKLHDAAGRTLTALR